MREKEKKKERERERSDKNSKCIDRQIESE